MIASLPMYDRAETATANDHLWQAIRSELGYGPETLTRNGDLWDHWLNPDLLLSQTCGYPYRARLHGKVNLVGTPDYALRDCPAGHYYSVLVIRRDEPRNAVSEFTDAPFAYNEDLSQSGWAAPQNHAAGLGFQFSNHIKTGGHRLSALYVAKGRADIAAIDGLTWEMLMRYDDFAKDLKVLDRTTPTPVLPYITSLAQDADRIFDAVTRAIGTLNPVDCDTLGLKGVVRIDPQEYLAVRNPLAPQSG